MSAKDIRSTAEIRKLGDLPNVHIKEVINRVAGRVIEHHPRREWVGYGGKKDSHFIEQDGHWWNGRGKKIAESDVPPELLAEAKARPKVAKDSGPRQARVCEHCNQPFLGEEYEKHLLALVREASGIASTEEITGLDG